MAGIPQGYSSLLVRTRLFFPHFFHLATCQSQPHYTRLFTSTTILQSAKAKRLAAQLKRSSPADENSKPQSQSEPASASPKTNSTWQRATSAASSKPRLAPAPFRSSPPTEPLERVLAKRGKSVPILISTNLRPYTFHCTSLGFATWSAGAFLLESYCIHPIVEIPWYWQYLYGAISVGLATAGAWLLVRPWHTIYRMDLIPYDAGGGKRDLRIEMKVRKLLPFTKPGIVQAELGSVVSSARFNDGDTRIDVSELVKILDVADGAPVFDREYLYFDEWPKKWTREWWAHGWKMWVWDPLKQIYAGGAPVEVNGNRYKMLDVLTTHHGYLFNRFVARKALRPANGLSLWLQKESLSSPTR